MKVSEYCFYLYYILSCQPGVTVTLCFVCKVIRDFESICHLCINPIHRKGFIHKRSMDSHWLRWSVQVNVLLGNCRQGMMSLSLLVGTTVYIYTNICLRVV